jgi:DNA-directed RNA polymerase subunit M/transcription elongation factor TFIIS
MRICPKCFKDWLRKTAIEGSEFYACETCGYRDDDERPMGKPKRKDLTDRIRRQHDVR